MTTLERLERWQRDEVIRPEQHAAISGLVRKQRFSLFVELSALLYIGILSLAVGLGWTFQTYFASLGDALIIAALTVAIGVALYYCFSKVAPFSVGEVPSPSFVFDYVAYLACLLLTIEMAFIKYRLGWLRQDWEYYFFSSIVFFLLAYRFDNRLVLSLGLSALAGAFGLKASQFDLSLYSSEPLRLSGLVYSALVVAAGSVLHRYEIKKHFYETFLHVAALISLSCLVSGLWSDSQPLYLLALLLTAAVTIALGVRFKRFVFVVYGTVFGYIGISYEAGSKLDAGSGVLIYFLASGIIVIVIMVWLARRFGREV